MTTIVGYKFVKKRGGFRNTLHRTAREQQLIESLQPDLNIQHASSRNSFWYVWVLMCVCELVSRSFPGLLLVGLSDVIATVLSVSMYIFLCIAWDVLL